MTTHTLLFGCVGLGALCLVACGDSSDTGVGGGGGSSSSATTSQTSGSTKSSASSGGPSSSSASGTTTSASSTASTASTSDASTSASTGMLSPECQEVADITVSNPAFVAAGGDGVWSVGEQAQLTVTLTNHAAAFNGNYPGVAVTSTDPAVSSSGNTLFGIDGNDSVDIEVYADAAVGAVPGDVTFTFAVASLQTACPEVSNVTLVVPLVP